MKNLMAFWNYDIFPYVVSGKVEKINEDGSIQSLGNHTFKPIIILPESNGREIQKEIDIIKSKFEKEKKELHKKYICQLYNVAPFLKEHLK